jgi:hypothetical protein
MRSAPLALVALLAIAGAVLPAQTVGTAYRSVTLPPEEIFVELVVATPPGTLVEQATGSLAPLGLGEQDLKTVGMLKDNPDRLGWQYCMVRPYITLEDTLKRVEETRRRLREFGYTLTYQFFLRASPKTIDATRRKVLGELMAEARRSVRASGKVRSVMFEPTPETVDIGRSASLFGQASGALQYQFGIVVVFEDE